MLGFMVFPFEFTQKEDVNCNELDVKFVTKN